MNLLTRRKWRYWKQDQRPDTTPRRSETADQKPPEGALFPKIHLLLLTSKSPPPTGYIAYFLFESFFPFVLSFLLHLVKCRLEQIFEDTKTPFYSSHLKNNFLCHLFGLLFLGRRFPPQPGLDGLSLLQQSRPAAYKCLKKSVLFSAPKPPQSLAKLKDKRSKNVANTFHVISAGCACKFVCLWTKSTCVCVQFSFPKFCQLAARLTVYVCPPHPVCLLFMWQSHECCYTLHMAGMDSDEHFRDKEFCSTVL